MDYLPEQCKKCIDKNNSCPGNKKGIGYVCPHFRDEKNTKPTNPKDIIGSSKLPYHLCPTTFIAGVGMAFLEGCLKYGRSNFRAVGVRASIYYDACLRHLIAWFEGEDIDPDSGLSHLYKAGACIAVLADAMEAGKLNDDRMIKGGYEEVIKKFTPMIKELKEKYKDKNPKHYTIKDNKSIEESKDVIDYGIENNYDIKYFDTHYNIGLEQPINENNRLMIPIVLIDKKSILSSTLKFRIILPTDIKIPIVKLSKMSKNDVITYVEERLPRE